MFPFCKIIVLAVHSIYIRLDSRYQYFEYNVVWKTKQTFRYYLLSWPNDIIYLGWFVTETLGVRTMVAWGGAELNISWWVLNIGLTQLFKEGDFEEPKGGPRERERERGN